MNTKRLIALLLCLATVVGLLPMSMAAEETATVAETSTEVTFNEFFDFNTMDVSTTADDASFATLEKEDGYFTTDIYGSNASGLSYVDRDGNGDMALRTTSQRGIKLHDSKLVLSDVSFVFEYDVRFEKVGGGYNTVQFSFYNNAGTQVKTGLVPINPNKLTGTDGNLYPATYYMKNNQNLGATVAATGVTADLIVYPDQWYHYAFYIDSVNNTIVAYRDGAHIWSSTLTSFPDDMTDFQIWMHSGNGSSITYYDNIHIQSFNSMDINETVAFEGVTFAEGATSVNATAAMLNSELSACNGLSFSYVHATNAIVETDGLNNYLVGSSTGKKLGDGNKSSYFQLKDSYTRLATTNWTFAFDLAVPGITNDKGTEDTADDTVYKYSSYAVSLFGVATDKSYVNDPDGKSYRNIWLVDNNGVLKYGASQTSTGITLTQGQWYRLFASYNAETQQVTISVLSKEEGYKQIGTLSYPIDKTVTETFFRFGYNWTANQYSKFYFDNFVLTTEDDVNIDLDFENGTAGERLIPSDISLGGAYASGAVNNGAFHKGTWSDSLKYYADTTGNTYVGTAFGEGSNHLWFHDRTLKTLTQKFVISFDFRINQATTTYTMAHWRIGTADIPLFIVFTDQKLGIRAKLNGKSDYGAYTPVLEDGKWYNFAVIIDPVNKNATFYMDGLDTEPLYTTSFDHDISAATASAFSFGPGAGKITVDGEQVNDHLGYDNVRIYTIDETVEEAVTPESTNTATLPASGVIVETDFEGFDADTAMTTEIWKTIAPFEVTTANGAVVENGGNKHFQPLNGSGATSFNISSFNASPYTDGVIAVETDFAFGDNSANSGNLVIAALKRLGVDGKTINVPLLTADGAGKLTVATHALDYTLPSETVRIRLELSYAFHTVNLYVDGEAVATGIPLNVNTMLDIPKKSFTDSFGNEHELPFTGYTYDYRFYNNGVQVMNENGSKAMFPHYYENYGYLECLSYIKDSIDMFGASADESWSFAADNLKIYQDKDADIYFNGFDSWTTDISSQVNAYNVGELPTENPFSNLGLKFIADTDGNTVASTVAEGYQYNNGSFFLQDKNNFFSGKSFVLEFDIKYNPDHANATLVDTGATILSSLKWDSTLLLYENGSFGVKNSDTKHGNFKFNDWSRVQALCLPSSSSSDHTVYIYVDGMLMSTTSAFSLANILRIGNDKETYDYDMKLDNIRIYLSDAPDAYESTSSGTLEGNRLLSLEISDTASLEKLMNNEKAGVSWNFKNFDTTSKDINESTLNVLLNKGDYVRVVHRELKDTSAYNLLVGKASLGGYEQYVFESEIRYTCPTGFELEVISLFDAATQSKDKLVYVLGTTREIVFNRNGFTYNLTDANGNKLYAENVTEDATAFTKIAVIVDEAAGTYSVYVNDRVAYYDYGGETVSATNITIDKTTIYTPNGLPAQTSSTVSLLNMPTSTAADALLDIKSANLYVLRTGVAPFVKSTQSKIEATKFDVRFIAPIDMLYGSEVGFDITTDQAGAKEATRSTNFVYSSIKALDPDTGLERDYTVEEFGGTYLAVISVTGANVVDTVKFTVKPFIKIGDSKIYNETFTVTYSDGKAVTE